MTDYILSIDPDWNQAAVKALLGDKLSGVSHSRVMFFVFHTEGELTTEEKDAILALYKDNDEMKFKLQEGDIL